MRVCLFCLLLFACPWILAQENENVAAEENVIASEASEQDESTSDESDDDEAAVDEDDVDFVPSVQISEDLSVSFPVDI